MKILNKINILYNNRHAQSGAALMVMLVILIVGASAMLLNSLNSAKSRLARDRVTMDALAQAKEVLIGYAITYGDTSTNVSGFLPCPDQGQNSTTDGAANSSCSAKNISVMGKFPWKTLGTYPIKDGNGDCLWYAVSGSYKNKPDTDLMNWDNNGLFQIMAPDGVNFLAGSTVDKQPVAIIFSPGTSIGSQSRTSATNTPSCGGNYTSSNYLDNDTVHGINNANVSTTANTLTQFISGQVKDVSGIEIVNDRLIIITKEDIFNVIKKRNDFGTLTISTLIDDAATWINNTVSCSGVLPKPKNLNFDTMSYLPGTTLGTHVVGRIPSTSCTGAPNNIVQKWRDNLAYAKCSSGQCFSLNGASCAGVIIFTGEKSMTQIRNSNSQKNDWANYLEGDALDIFTSTDTSISTASPSYSSASPSTDIWRCIP